MKKLIILGLAACLCACSFSKPYVGRSVSPENPSVCRFSEFPQTCQRETKHYNIEFTITKLPEPEHYVIEGSASRIGICQWK